MGGGTVRVIDFTDKSNPVLIGGLVYEELGTRTGWISRDGNYLFSFERGATSSCEEATRASA